MTSGSPPGWIDCHCHLPADAAAADAVVDRARAEGVDWVVSVGTDLVTSQLAVETAHRRPDVRATVGLHPHDAIHREEQWPALVQLAADPAVVAVGEAGLDHHYEHSPGPDQAAAFRAQIRLAHELDLTLVIHTREAWAETFAILDEESVPRRTVFHCFTGGPAEAEACVVRGAWLSFSGIVTFKNATELRAAALVTPIDRILVETDSPYLAPVPFRGSTNEPARVGVVGTAVAEIRGMTAEDFAAAIRPTVETLFSPA